MNRHLLYTFITILIASGGLVLLLTSNGNESNREDEKRFINDYIETAEEAYINGDSITCLQYVEKCLSHIEEQPDSIDEYLRLYESDILVGSLQALYAKGGVNAVMDFLIKLRNIDYLVYSEANNNGLKLPSFSKWGYQMYWNWAQLCFDAKIWEPALLVFDEVHKLYSVANIQPEYDSINNILPDDVFIRQIQFIIAYELKDDLKALSYITQSVLEAIMKYGKYDSKTIVYYNRAYSHYSVITSPELLSLPEHSEFHLSLSYEEYISHIQLWRAFQDSIVNGYGNSYLDSLNLNSATL